jgi:restriction endonuclease S subunit
MSESSGNRQAREPNRQTAPSSADLLRVNPGWAKLPIFERKGWKHLPFAAFAESINERVEPADAAEDIYVGLDDLDSCDLHIRRWGKGSDVIGTKLRFRKGDIIFGRRRAYQRKLAVAEMDGICSAHAMVVRAKPALVLPEFLPFLMMNDRFMNRAVEISVGSLSPTINWTTLKLEPFDLPPLEQQSRIAEVLKAVNHASRMSEDLKSTLTSTRLPLVDSLIPTPMSAVNRDQKFIRLDQVASMLNGHPFPSASYQQTGIKLIRPGNLAIDGTLTWAPNATVSLPEKFLKESRGWLIEANQVLINLTAQSLEDGFMGRVCFTGLSDQGLLNQRIGKFVLSDAVIPKFFFHCLQTTPFRALVENRCEGSKIRHLYFRHFQDFPIPVLDKLAQMKIVEQMEAFDVSILAAERATTKLIELQQVLIDRLS